MVIKNVFKKYVNFAIYTMLNYIDKALIVAIPILYLLTTKNQNTYNKIEFIISLGAVIAPVFEFGLRNYLLYGYRDSDNPQLFVGKASSYFLIISYLYFIVWLIISIVLKMLNLNSFIIFAIVGIRILYNNIFAFFSIVARLKDSPSKIFLLSITVNGITCILIMVLNLFNIPLSIQLIFLTHIIAVLGFGLYICINRIWKQWHGIIEYVKKALIYSWPLILNIFLVMLAQNIGKIYTKLFLNEEAMTRIALAQRVTLIIQLGHTSITGYLSKKMFLEKGLEISKKILLLYTLVLSVSIAMCILFSLLLYLFMSSYNLLIDPIFYIMIIYTALWCYSAFFEIYLSRNNKNIYIPITTVISFSLFIIALMVFKFMGVMGIAFAMGVHGLMSLILIMITIKALKKKYVYNI